MLYSISWSHASSSLKFQGNTIPTSTSSQKAKLQHHTWISLPKSSHLSAYHVRLRSRLQSQKTCQTNFPLLLSRTSVSLEQKSTALQCGISSNSYSTNDGRSSRGWIEWFGDVISNAFPLWVSFGCLLGLVSPSYFSWVTQRWTIVGLSLIMLGMGMTLTFDDLRGAIAMPKELMIGFVLQYSVMSMSGFLISKLLSLPSHYAAGLILVGCCPGGTASNIVTYIARGNVALSVLMTAASTISAVIMTPFLTAKLAGQYAAVDAAGLVVSTLQVVLLPVLVGAFLNHYFQGLVKFVSPLMPPLAVGTVAVLCGHAIAQSASAILVSGRLVILASALLHASGFFFGYLFSRLLGLDIASSRTISIEVGMQNSALGLVLANQHFSNPLTAVPCAVSSILQSILGSGLAGIWRRNSPEEKQG
ncbi:hypothetical protein SLE2022_313010 [Rubroshorea leprosula]